MTSRIGRGFRFAIKTEKLDLGSSASLTARGLSFSLFYEENLRVLAQAPPPGTNNLRRFHRLAFSSTVPAFVPTAKLWGTGTVLPRAAAAVVLCEACERSLNRVRPGGTVPLRHGNARNDPFVVMKIAGHSFCAIRRSP